MVKKFSSSSRDNYFWTLDVIDRKIKIEHTKIFMIFHATIDMLQLFKYCGVTHNISCSITLAFTQIWLKAPKFFSFPLYWIIAIFTSYFIGAMNCFFCDLDHNKLHGILENEIGITGMALKLWTIASSQGTARKLYWESMSLWRS